MHHEPSPCMPGRLARMHWLCMGGPLVPASPAMSTAQAITRNSTAPGSAVLPRTACICAGGGAPRARAESIFSHAAPNVNVGRPHGARFAGRSRTSWGAHTRRTTDAQSHLDLEPSALRRSAASFSASNVPLIGARYSPSHDLRVPYRHPSLYINFISGLLPCVAMNQPRDFQRVSDAVEPIAQQPQRCTFVYAPQPRWDRRV